MKELERMRRRERAITREAPLYLPAVVEVEVAEEEEEDTMDGVRPPLDRIHLLATSQVA